MTTTRTSAPVLAVSDLSAMGYDMSDTKTIALLGVLFSRPRHAGSAATDETPGCRHAADAGCSGATSYDARHADAEAIYAGCI